MAKKYHAVCVGRNPGLYTEWAGPDGAEIQKSGISGYQQKTGILSTNNLNEAILFLQTNPIRSVMFNFNSGTAMSFDELVQKDTRLAKLIQNANLNIHTPVNQQKTVNSETIYSQIQTLDSSRIVTEPVFSQVNDYCNTYGFNHLSVDQRRAVQAVNGKYLLFAVPGSGKTTVMMARAGYMVHACGIPAGQLMNMTFTRASAKEMQDRYRRYFPNDDESLIPDFRTIHSFCMSIVIPKLRRAGFVCPRHVIDEDKRDKTKKKKEYTQRAILSAVLKKHEVKKYADETAQETVQTAISSIKNRDMARNEYSHYSVRINKQDYSVALLYESYQEKLQELDCMDYDDMLVNSLKGLREFPKVLLELQGKYKYWSIDEAQDNSRVQNDLLELLCGENGNLFMVGDDDQSIYSFRGAQPDLLIAFGNRPNVRSLVMGTNFRSYSDIVSSAKAFVEYNKNRANKEMKASHEKRGTICVPSSFRNEAEQYAYIDQAAKSCLQQGKRLGVLYQLNASALPLIVHMHRAGIPFEASKGLSELRSMRITGKLFRILCFANRPAELKNFKESRKDLGLWSENAELDQCLENAHQEQPDTPILQLILDCGEYNKHREEIQKIHSVLSKTVGLKPAEALETIIHGLADGLKVETLSERLSVYGLLSVCDLYDTLPDMLADLEAMKKKEKQRSTEDDDIPDEETDDAVFTRENPVVSLSTIHSAKGREWDHVILIDSFQEVFPGQGQPDRIGFDPEEARRVFYVAITRAIERLDILTVDAYHDNIEPASIFISEYAFEADRVVGHPVEESVNLTVIKPGVLCKFEPGKYYSVPYGSKPGVYTDWNEVKALIDGVSPPKGCQGQKSFDTYEEAWEWAFPGQPSPKHQKLLSYESIKRYIHPSGCAAFNDTIDLPNEVSQGLLDYLKVSSLRDLSPDQRQQLIEQSRFDWTASHTDYHGRTDGYAVGYMAVNFYKIWLPLWKLLEENKLPVNPTILEIGPGPGTSTWSLIEFYKRLALENPSEQFSLSYTAVEKESDFSALFQNIQEKVLSALPENLKVSMRLLFETDAFAFMNGLSGNDVDLVIESNVLNAQENFTKGKASAYLFGLRESLSSRGNAILIEPLEKQNPSQLTRLIDSAVTNLSLTALCLASNAAVNVGGIGLFHDALAANIRYSHRTEHWFSYAILAPKESA